MTSPGSLLYRCRWIILGIAAVMICTAAAVGALDRGPETLVLNGGSNGNVTVPHLRHQKALNEDCQACHLLFPQKSGSVDQLKADGTLKKKDLMNTCIKCHRQKASAGMAAGPVKCKECHVK